VPRYKGRLTFIGGTTIDQGDERVEVTAWLYAQGEAPASSFTGRYVLFDNSPEVRTGAALIQFSSGDEAEGVITHAGPRSGRFKINEPLREISRRRSAKPS
jgi:hypothetical protein